jgi:nuclear pore complex protein Nup98-Nup96
VPVTWVARARAVLARTQGKYKELTQQLIKACDWNEAHKVVVSEIAPSALLSQDYTKLEEFLNSLAEAASLQKIAGWESEGRVYLEFIRADTAVNILRQTRDIENLGYELERLKPIVTGLCRTIANLPVNNSKQRLSQSEIAKKVAHFMRAVYSFESSRGEGAAATARQLAESLSTLPLPEDYALQELRTLTRSYLAEIMDQ